MMMRCSGAAGKRICRENAECADEKQGEDVLKEGSSGIYR